MLAANNNSIFGQQDLPHTVIIARGDTLRQFTLGRRWLVAGAAAVAVVIGTLGAAGYALTRSDLAMAADQPGEDAQAAYEARIAALRQQLDRITSRQMLTQKLVDTKLKTLLDQQSEISDRYTRLQPLLDQARSAGLLPPAVAIPTPKPSPQAMLETEPKVEPVRALAFAGDSHDKLLQRFKLVDTGTGAERRAAPPTSSGLPDALLEVGTRLDDVARGQRAQIDLLKVGAEQRAAQIAAALKAEGIDYPDSGESGAPKGGPFVPPPGTEDFEASVDGLENALEALNRLKDTTDRLPLGAPIGATTVSSGFGVRKDPFLGEPALHPGIDFVAGIGTRVEAAAAGKVTLAGAAGSYGNMVEIDHGKGIVTRYAHLSAVYVTAGQAVQPGDTIGAVGSTGRSTGAHLHYEVREDDKPINPARFLRAGRRLRSFG
ncbi:M23 family metallopeptidase [Mangrovibrevibacter kandeliae]|uniref:M23 family metallopeptidase n=1 Tax=Mangrovibrevibacter kandeliae TaxID=2968473 RepID=UPI0021174FB1|nr:MULTISPECIES: M23 family metallopeptidase [unclassified Aurantimonas]MCQ8782536.1 M23 family metallopeptidase [Aurantimonas sp. CSK15Z-1]MCW4114655.1 M23 family metallopeptidase [Aurantimonas sp. MSK8Z-1]